MQRERERKRERGKVSVKPPTNSPFACVHTCLAEAFSEDDHRGMTTRFPLSFAHCPRVGVIEDGWRDTHLASCLSVKLMMPPQHRIINDFSTPNFSRSNYFAWKAE